MYTIPRKPRLGAQGVFFEGSSGRKIAVEAISSDSGTPKIGKLRPKIRGSFYSWDAAQPTTGNPSTKTLKRNP